MFWKRTTILKATHPNSRVIVGTLAAALIYQVLHRIPEVHPSFNYLITYNAVVLIYLVMFFIRIAVATAEDTRRISQQKEPSTLWMLGVVIILSFASIAALVSLADTPKTWPREAYQLHVFLSLLALFSSWVLVHIFFGLHYAQRYYYQDGDDLDGPFLRGLQFPGEGDLVHYWDFMYMAFSIGMCYGTTDVDVLSREMRILTLFHSVFSFMYVLVILGLVVNFISTIV